MRIAELCHAKASWQMTWSPQGRRSCAQQRTVGNSRDLGLSAATISSPERRHGANCVFAQSTSLRASFSYSCRTTSVP
jgi:hypothetical protein